MTDKNIIKALECCINDDCDNCPDTFGNCEHNAMRNALNLINRQKAEIERLKIENQSLRGAANSYKLHYNEAKTEAVKEVARQRDKAIKDFEKFAQRAFIDNPFACEYCVHSVENGRACLWKAEHEDDEEGCFGRHFEYKGE